MRGEIGTGMLYRKLRGWRGMKRCVACRDVMRDVRWQKTGRRRFSELPVKWKMTVLFTFLFSFTPSYFWNVFLFPFITGHRLFFDVWQQLIRTFEPNRKQFKYESSLLTFLPQIAHLYLNMNIFYTMFISSIFQNELSLLHFYEKKNVDLVSIWCF